MPQRYQERGRVNGLIQTCCTQPSQRKEDPDNFRIYHVYPDNTVNLVKSADDTPFSTAAATDDDIRAGDSRHRPSGNKIANALMVRTAYRFGALRFSPMSWPMSPFVDTLF